MARGALFATFLTLCHSPLGAQQTDTSRVGVSSKRPESVDTVSLQTPISPRRAFLRSLLLPGWGQMSLGRGTAGGLFVLLEGASAAMIIKAREDLGRAKDARADRIFQGFQINAVTGELDLKDGKPIPIFTQNPLSDRVRPRRQHLEDWIALLAFNHLFAGAEAFVAAHLYDVPARISVRPAGQGVVFAARITW